MNEIFIARKAFDACLISSAALVEVRSSGGGSVIVRRPMMALSLR
jgi:hypothetical protein